MSIVETHSIDFHAIWKSEITHHYAFITYEDLCIQHIQICRIFKVVAESPSNVMNTPHLCLARSDFYIAHAF